ncbi:MAG: pyridoxal-phosphate dependent enzyme [Bacteroidales bacterium]
MIPTQKEVIEAQKRVSPHIHNTPVLRSSSLDKMVDAQIHFKCENFQRMGAFKYRGAVNALLQLSKEQLSRGVITHSSGNFAAALSLAARTLGTKAIIVMPSNVNRVKLQAVEAYGGSIVTCEPTLEAREKTTRAWMESTGATLLHPSNQREVILGNATAALELTKQAEALDVVLAPVGGGGLLAGTALACTYVDHNMEIIGAEPFGADDAYLSLKTGKIQPSVHPRTMADGLRTQLGDQNFPIIQKFVSRIIRVEESEIAAAMRLVWERMKIIIEPSSAVAVAALLREKKEFEKRRIGVILSGGNVDLDDLPF